ncbi:MAG: DUF4432 domain-containing protein [Chloroflexi bacterium RBG_16_57_11]|nr:MAG: DUF4432 domain-containing protein [Chloroflexi bacterium RBG_16_57_11]
MKEAIFHLIPEQFSPIERNMVEADGLSACTFQFESGVCALRLKNEQGEVVILPFQGQQIWSAEFGGRPLGMTSFFKEPQPTRVYLETYGGFLLHCGATAMGVPSAQDSHPLHGELPNAPYRKAWVILGEDEGGEYIGLGGQYHHIVAFNHNYTAEPVVKLYRKSSLLHIALTIHNLKRSPMEWMYLAHINFRPVDDGRMVYSALPTPEHVRVRLSIPSHIRPGPGYVDFLQELKEHPERHHVFTPDKVFDPEVVFAIDYLADEQGWAHSMHVHPDGSADYVRFRPAQLDKCIRWIVRTADQQALGFAMPSTAEPEGYTAEKAKGNIKLIPGGVKVAFEIVTGYVNPTEAREFEVKIEKIVASARG